MAKVWKRTWTTDDGEHEAWVADYFSREKDGRKKRHIKTFKTQKAANAYLAQVRVDIGKGIHTAPSGSKTVAQAAADWLAYVEAEGRERATIKGYREHVNLHIVPYIGDVKLADLTSPD